MTVKKVRVGLIGAGYIADWHAKAIAATGIAEVSAVCDLAREQAQGLAAAHRAIAYGSVDELLAARICDAVHVVTPPESHAALAIRCLEAGLHVLVEKPFATTRADAEAMHATAERVGRTLAVGHNFLGVPGYERLKRLVDAGGLGRITAAQFNWHFPLEPLRSGPFGLWMLRAPQNLLLELGPHLYAFAYDLFGPIEDIRLTVGKPIDVPGSGPRFQSWRILARAGTADLTFHLSLVETIDDRSVTLQGSSGRARLDFANDVLVVERRNARDIIVAPLLRELSLAGQHIAGSIANATRQTLSLNQASPYALSFKATAAAFYKSISTNTPVDARFSSRSALAVMDAIERTHLQLPVPVEVARKPQRQVPADQPRTLVIGGTGFIGRRLTEMLAEQGRPVRVLSRGRSRLFDDCPIEVEHVACSLKDHDGLVRAMENVDVVVNLARSLEKTWQACLDNDVGPAIKIAEAAMTAGVRRLIYTGTIASYDMSRSDTEISEETGFAADMSDRNLYARSKAHCEERLLTLHREKGLPLVIARPGIVVGKGGPLQHWGIGRWDGAGAVRIWGHGRNKLPFVLVDDVCDGLIRMMDHPDAVGHSFNLVGDSMLSAQDYFDAIHARLGARIDVKSSSLDMLYAADAMKFLAKRHLLGKRDISRPSRADWRSRAHFSPFRNDLPKRLLGWRPESDRDRFLQKAIVDANLFGF